jgi:hypothetical protein
MPRRGGGRLPAAALLAIVLGLIIRVAVSPEAATTTLLIGWAAWSGGQIRHDEIRSAAGVRPADLKDPD